MSGAFNGLKEQLTDTNQVKSAVPRALADKLLDDVFIAGTVQWTRGQWWRYVDGLLWHAVDEVALKAEVAQAMRDWWYIVVKDRKNGDAEEQTKFLYNALRNSLLADVLGQLRQPGRSMIPDTTETPCWLDGKPGGDEFTAMRNGLLHRPTRALHPHTPLFFDPVTLPYDFDPEATCPNWLAFLTTLWGEDMASCELLQLWFGYLLMAGVPFDKLLLIIGPKRSGKGTIARISKAMIGEKNTCGPTLAGLARDFGLANIINKRLAVVGDARLSARTDTAVVVERLLSLTGNDTLDIPRKFLSDWSGTPACKFCILSNDIPRLPDASGTIVSRMLLLETSESFFGREDHGLEPRLMTELPGILNWALDGLDRLTALGRFPDLPTAREALEQMSDLSSPVSAFVRDWCELSPGFATPTAELYAGFQRWCESEGAKHVPTAEMFGRDFKSACPDVKKRVFRSGGGRREKNYQGIRLIR